MWSSAVLFRLGATLAVALTTAACEGESPTPLEPTAAFDKSVHAGTAPDALLRSVRHSTARFHSTVQAVQAGYVANGHCVAVPGLGGMGDHWVNSGNVDGTFDPNQPEALLYAPGSGGGLRLVGVEYIVLAGPGEDLNGPNRPRFGDHPFDIGGTPIPAPHWSLHVWLYEANPSGLFAPFNPNVSCS